MRRGRRGVVEAAVGMGRDCLALQVSLGALLQRIDDCQPIDQEKSSTLCVTRALRPGAVADDTVAEVDALGWRSWIAASATESHSGSPQSGRTGQAECAPSPKA